jgi:Holliday junction resolvasome RuvABC ATP-dependent DNA helicase subunit
LSNEERDEAIQFLEQKDLLQRTNELIGKSGVIGEETNRLLMYLIFTSRKREHPLHVISLGNSGIGKTYLQEKVGELIPDEDKVEITTLAENALHYCRQTEFQRRLVMTEDLDAAESLV